MILLKYKKLILYSFLLLVVILSSPVFSQDKPISSYNFLSGRDFLNLEGLITYGFTDYKTLPGGGINGLFEHYFSSDGYSVFGLNLEAGKYALFGKDLKKNPDGFKTNMISVGPNAIFSYGFTDFISANITGGVSYLWFNPMVEGGVKSPNNRKGIYKNNTVSYNFGGGIRIAITDMILFSINAGMHYASTDYLDDLSGGKYNDNYLTGSAGLSIALFNRNEAVKKITPQEGTRRYYNIPKKDTIKIPVAVKKVDSVFTTNIKHSDIQDSSKIAQTNKKSADSNEIKTVQPDKKVEDLEKKIAELEKTVEDLKTKVKEPEKEVAEENKKVTELERKVEKNEKKLEKPEKKEKEITKEKKGPLDDVSVQTDITFLSEKTDIRPEARPILERIATYLKKYPNVKWKIEVHVDEGNTSSQSESLAKQRGDAILNYFKRKGLPASNFNVTYMGDKYPIDQNSTAYGRMKNRRIEIKRTQ